MSATFSGFTYVLRTLEDVGHVNVAFYRRDQPDLPPFVQFCLSPDEADSFAACLQTQAAHARNYPRKG